MVQTVQVADMAQLHALVVSVPEASRSDDILEDLHQALHLLARPWPQFSVEKALDGQIR